MTTTNTKSAHSTIDTPSSDNVQFFVPSISDLDAIYEFAANQLVHSIPDEIDRQFHLWTVSWRKESLEHYLKLGWSFLAKEGSAQNPGPVCGFFLAQPMLFLRGQTQTLWMESIVAKTPELAMQLADIAIRVAREKHFQRVLISEQAQVNFELSKLSAGTPTLLKEGIYEVRTSKG